MTPLRLRRPFACVLLSLALASPCFAAAAPAAPAPRIDLRALATAKSFGQFIVKYRAGSAALADRATLDARLARAAERAQAQLRQEQAARGIRPPAAAWSVRSLRRLAVGADVFSSSRKLDAQQVRLLLEQVAADAEVEYVEIDQTLHEDFTPNDTAYANEWGLFDADAGIRADRAWDLNNGSGVVVAVVDTGYTDHSDLVANILPGYDFISDVAQANDGNGRDADAHDPGNWSGSTNSNWHGTHVAGTIGAVTNNAKGVAGAAFGAKLLPVRVLGVGGGAGSDIADAIVWASGGSVSGAPVNAHPAKVINLSIGGGGGCSATYQNAINSAVSRGATVVVAAGNDNLDTAGGSLSTCANVVVVGAHTSGAARSSFSNYGAMVDVSAPGSSVYSTVNTGTTVPAAEGYAYYQGTSMATPHVASAAALTQAYRIARGLPPYTPAQVEIVLKATAYPMLGGCSVSSGAGIVDARTLLDTADGAVRLVGNGTPVGSQAAATGTGLRFGMVASTTAQGLTFSSSGGTGDADMYVKFGSMPTTSSYDCRSSQVGNSESCSIAVAQPGTYYMLLQAASAYSGVTVVGSPSGNRKPAAAFNVASNGLTANFTDASSDADGGVTARSWSFGDGTSSAATNPSHAYAIAGGYTVQLSASDGAGASNCVLKQVNVNPPPVALSNGVAATGLAANVGAQLPFTLAVPSGASNLRFATTGGSGDADLYVKFGSPPTLSSYDCISGSETTVETCNMPSATAGTWYVMVHAYTNISGVSLTGSYSGGSANQAPVANFSFSSNGLTASFTDTSTDSDGSIASRSWSFGDGSASTLANPSHTYAASGTYSVKLTVADNGGLSSSVTKQVTVSGGGGGVGISIGDVVLDEGNSLTRAMNFTVQLSAAASTAVTYNIATADGTATAGSDYTAKSLSAVSIPAGTLSKVFSVSIKGDTVSEPDETFTVTLSGVSGANVTDGQAVGTIRNDDGAPGSASISIDNLSIAEGNSGTKQAVFTVRLSQPASGNVVYNIATENGTALAGSDYVAASANGQTIPAGQTSKTFSVTVNGDTVVETNERFKVNLSGVTGAAVADAQAIGTIINDD